MIAGLALVWSAFVLVSASLGLPLLWTLLELCSIRGARWRSILFGPLCGLIGFTCLAVPEALEGLDGARFTPAFVALCAGTIGGAVFAGLAGGRGRRDEHP